MRNSAVVVASLASCALLAWMGALALAPLGAAHAAARDYRVVMWPPEGERQHVGIQGLVVDGQHTPLHELGLEGEWQYRWYSKRWLLKGGAPGTLSFEARQATILFEPRWGPQRIEVIADGVVVAEAEAASQRRRDRIRAIDVPVIPEPWPWAVLLAGVLAVVLLAARPWLSERRTEIWLLLYVSLLHVAFGCAQSLAGAGDSAGYLHDSRSLMSALRPSYFPPGYPLFLWALRWTGAGFIQWVTIAQAGLATAAALWMFRLARATAGVPLAFAAVLAAVSSPVFLGLPRSLLADSLTSTTMLGAVYFAFEQRRTGHARHGVAAGLLACAATAVRIFPVGILLPIFVALHFRAPLRQNLRRALLPVGVTVVTLGLPVLFALATGRGAGLANSAGGHLYNGMVEAKQLWAPEGETTSRYRAALLDERGRIRSQFAMRKLLTAEHGLSLAEAEEVMRSIAWEAVLANPGGYLVATLAQTWEQLQWAPWTPWHPNVRGDPEELENSRVAATSATAVEVRQIAERWQKALWPGLAWMFALATLCLAFATRPAGLLALAGLPLGVAAVVSAVEHGAPTYSSIHATALLTCAIAGTGVLMRELAPRATRLLVADDRHAYPRAGWAVVAVLGCIAAAWLGHEFWRLVDGGSELWKRQAEVGGWFAGDAEATPRGTAPVAPAGVLVLWPFLGWTGRAPASWIWAALALVATAWIARWSSRTSRADSPPKRAIAALLPLSMYATGTAIGHGHLTVHLLAATLAALALTQSQKTWGRDIAVAALLVTGMADPLVALPFLWLFVARPEARRAGAIALAAYCAATVTASAAHGGGAVEQLAQWWQGTREAIDARPVWLAQLDYDGPGGATSLVLWLMLGVWVWANRKSDLWVVTGVCAVAGRLGTYHGWHADVLIAPAMVALFRCAQTRAARSRRVAGWLLVVAVIVTLAPGGYRWLPWPWNQVYVWAQVTIWFAMLAYLGQAARSTAQR